jgi:hypothetical protein
MKFYKPQNARDINKKTIIVSVFLWILVFLISFSIGGILGFLILIFFSLFWIEIFRFLKKKLNENKF